MERLRLVIEKTPLATYDDNKNLFVTISTGIIIWNGKEPLNIQTLLARADEALYKSKQTGRNKTTIWEKT